MRSFSKPGRAIMVSLALAFAAAGAVIASAATSGADPKATTISVAPHTVLSAPAKSPFDAPGTPAVRRGKPIPTGYRIVGRAVSINRGDEAAYAAMRLACPAGTITRTLAASELRTSRIGVQLVGKYHTTYARVIADFGPAVKRGQTVTGTVYLVCRKA